MGKYFITGRQGSGKTTVIKLLQERGFTAYNTDDLPEATKLQDKETGEVIVWPEGKVDWAKYAWNWQRPEIERLLASDETVFLGAIVSNQADFYPLFDKVFVITVDSDTLRQRLEAHEHESHHLPGEIERMLVDHESKQEKFIKAGAEPISGGRPPEEIVDDILKRVGLSQ
ncbi:MAG: AAA family ATPase [Candidatus Adlerbacteria bacterium]